MRAVLVGASKLSVMTARLLLRRRHEVVIIERDKERIDALASELDCGFLHGDGSKPAILREADPEHTDMLLCLTGNDQTNMLASLVGRSLGFPRIVTRVDDPELEHICIELGLEDMIIPSRTIGRYLADLFQGINVLDASNMLKGEARIFTFVAREDDAVKVGELKLPSLSRVVCLYRNGDYVAVDDDSAIEVDDQVVVITHAKQLAELRERWAVELEKVRKH